MSSVFNNKILNIFNLKIDNVKQIMYNEDGGNHMTIEQKLNMALSYKGMSQAELARKIGTTPSNLNQKVKRNTLTKEEMEKIADALGGKWRAEFEFPDGTTI